MKFTIKHEGQARIWNVHPAIAVGSLVLFGLCTALTLWLLHPTPSGKDAGSRAYTVILIYFGALIGRYLATAVLTLVEKSDKSAPSKGTP